MVEQGTYGGVHAVLYALFNADETVDHGAMAAQVDFCIDKGCHGITVLGLATEVLKLTFDERLALIGTAAAATGGRVPLSVTIPGNSVAEQTALANHAREHGADWLILQPPLAGSYDAEVYLDFFKRVAASAKLPVAIQNAPQYLGRALSGPDLARLGRRCPNLVAVKSEDEPKELRSVIEAAGDSLEVLGGRGGLDLIVSLDAGCRGFVLAPDIAPLAASIWRNWRSGKGAQAVELYDAAAPAIEFSMRSLEHLVTCGKRIFAAQVGISIHDRSPSSRASREDLRLCTRYGTLLSSLCAES